jgi:murein DD-endopeptidase MepM/ murein hydrolase activator NlpD
LRVLGGALVVLVLGAGASAEAAFAGGATTPGATGGAEYGQPMTGPPVVRRFSVAPSKVTAPALPRIRVRLDREGARTVRARVVLWPVAGTGAKLVRLDLGRVRVGRVLTAAWPTGAQLAPGRYTVRIHVRGAAIARSSGLAGRASLVVLPKPAPKPPPEPRPEPPVPPRVVEGGVFPVAGPHSYPPGGEFGNDRGTHGHQGVDISAAAGTPVLAPVAGVARVVGDQPSAAGLYVVLRADDGREMFFAHCQERSVVVLQGDRVAQGAKLCAVGSTGRSTGPHLHFELWPDGWRTSKDAAPVDPKPQLLAWDPDF